MWKPWLFFLAAMAAIVVPVLALLILGLGGPEPYVPTAQAPEPGTYRQRELSDGTWLSVSAYADAAAARRSAKQTLRDIPTSRSGNTLHRLDYRRADDQRWGLLLPVGHLVLQAEAANREVLMASLQTLPEIQANPRRNLVALLLSEHLGAAAVGLLLYLLLFAVLLSRGASWAASIAPQTSVAQSAEHLRARLLALNDLPLPFVVRELPDGKLRAEWRIADAQWVGLMQAGGLNSTHQIDLQLDPERHCVRVLDRLQRLAWSAGVGRSSFAWQWFRGIQFVHHTRGAGYGVLLDDHGNWSVAEAYRYRFQLQELRGPLVEAVVGSGWAWRPVMFFNRWLAP